MLQACTLTLWFNDRSIDPQLSTKIYSGIHTRLPNGASTEYVREHDHLLHLQIVANDLRTNFFGTRKVLGIENRPLPTQATSTIDVDDAVHDHYVVVEGESICRFLRQKGRLLLPAIEHCKADLVPVIARPTLTSCH
jgi:hypothetical protein